MDIAQLTQRGITLILFGACLSTALLHGLGFTYILFSAFASIMVGYSSVFILAFVGSVAMSISYPLQDRGLKAQYSDIIGSIVGFLVVLVICLIAL